MLKVGQGITPRYQSHGVTLYNGGGENRGTTMIASLKRWRTMRQVRDVRKIVRRFRHDRSICRGLPAGVAAFMASHIKLYQMDRSHFHPRALRLFDKEWSRWEILIAELRNA